MKKNIKNLVIFLCICSVITLLLAATNFITSPVIEKNQNALANKALLEVMPNGKGFDKVDISAFTLPATVTEAHKENIGGGYVIKLVTSGYGNDMVIMCGVDANGVVTGAVCLSSNETLGYEKTYGETFTDKNSESVDAVDIVSGATKTTQACKNAVKDALSAAVILGGGSVDIRNEEEILADNLSSALPDGEGFEKMFLTEELEGIDAVYTAKDDKGYVFVIGEKFIGVNADGALVTDETENEALITAAVNKIKTSSLKDIDISRYEDLKNFLVSAKKTTSGNYVVETKGAGYGIKGGDEYHPASNEYIIVRVSMTKDLKIIDCVTVSQAETKGIGDVCQNESFYGQFVGKNETNYTEIDAISGATLTTNGYKQAIERAFTAVKTIKGGAK